MVVYVGYLSLQLKGFVRLWFVFVYKNIDTDILMMFTNLCTSILIFCSERQFMYQRTNLNIIEGENLNVGYNTYLLT